MGTLLTFSGLLHQLCADSVYRLTLADGAWLFDCRQVRVDSGLLH